MNQEEKMQYFEEQVNKQTQKEIQDQLSQYESTLKKDFDSFVKQIDETYQERLESDKETIRKNSNKRYSRLQVEQMRELYLRRQEIKSKVFEAIDERLDDYKKTDAYLNQLKQNMASIAAYAQDEDYVLYIDRSDEHLRNELEKEGHLVQISSRDFKGGMRGVLEKRHVLLDYSFSNFLDRSEDEFTLKEMD